MWYVILQELFFTFPWNNFLHMQVELCVQSVLCRTEEGEGEGEGGKSAALVTAGTEENLKLLRVHVSSWVWLSVHWCGRGYLVGGVSIIAWD